MSAPTYDLIVVGGGPAGSTAATIAARKGLSVLLLEAASHPRAHVGESLLPGIIPILEEMNCLTEVETAGFTRKTGSTHWGWGLSPAWDLWFADSEIYDYSWLADRSVFDAILFRAAARAGADARENTAVKSFVWEGERALGVRFKTRGDDTLHEARAPLTIDASGHAALLGRGLQLRENIEGLKHEASWAQYEGAGRLPPPRDKQALFAATTTHWIWHFPLSEDRTSVGIIRMEDQEGATDASRERAFDETVRASVELSEVLGPGAKRVTPVRSARDWSYRMRRVTGPGFLMAGDASGFIDPVLATGVMLAMHAGFHAGRLAVKAALGASEQAEALSEYQAQHDAIFHDMLRVVRYFYQQNLHRDEYFWESKRILAERLPEVKPQKAFMVLTSGLVRNLAYEEKSAAVQAKRAEATASGEAPEIDAHDPERLRFVCFHMRHEAEGDKAALYFLIEPTDPAAPSLFRTRNFHLNCLAPRYDNDPIQVASLAPHLRTIERTIRALDVVPDEPLVSFWRRTRVKLVDLVKTLSADVVLVRVFGE